MSSHDRPCCGPICLLYYAMRGKPLPFEVKVDTVLQLGGGEPGSPQAAGSRKTLPGGSLSVSSGCRKCFIDLLRFSTQGFLFPVHGTWPPNTGIMLAMEPGDSNFLLILAVAFSKRDPHFPGRWLWLFEIGDGYTRLPYFLTFKCFI